MRIDAIFSLTLVTARNTPLPKNLLISSVSLSSRASCLPVDAPDGVDAVALIPELVQTSTSTVGYPRESSISRAFIDLIIHPKPSDVRPLTPLLTQNCYYL